jgi:hypothetical protein
MVASQNRKPLIAATQSLHGLGKELERLCETNPARVSRPGASESNRRPLDEKMENLLF